MGVRRNAPISNSGGSRQVKSAMKKAAGRDRGSLPTAIFDFEIPRRALSWVAVPGGRAGIFGYTRQDSNLEPPGS